MEIDPFKEYEKTKEPDKAKKAYAWKTGIGLQDVDGLEPSSFLVETARSNIEGKITLEEASKRIESYYRNRPKEEDPERKEEADKVSGRIASLLSEDSFTFSASQLFGIHKRLFEGIYPHAGRIRDFDIRKKEWILDGKSVIYASASEIEAALEYDLSKEAGYRYEGQSMEEIINHLASFISKLWQIHPFEEGNTRTFAVFFIKYLRSLGFEAENDTFADNAWYWRNALVRANYNDLKNGIRETNEYVELFLKNLLLGEKNILQSRDLHI